jgi:hypothetical protein
MEKKLNLEQGRLRVEYPAADIEVWAMDEHRLYYFSKNMQQ